MSYGPIELLVLKFPGNRFSGEIIPALAELVENGTVRIIDLMFVRRDGDGTLTIIELTDLDAEDRTAFEPIVDDVNGMMSEEDALVLASSLEPNSSAGLLLFENVWATRFVDAVRNANGEVILNERIPRTVIDELLEAYSE